MKMKSIEQIIDYFLMEQELSLCIEYSEMEDEEVEHWICDEDDYPYVCPFKDTYHLKDEVVQDELIDSFF